MPDVSDMGYFRRTLEARKVGMLAELPGEMMRDHALIDASMSYFGGDMLALRLTSYVLSDQLVSEGREVTVDVPASWWQHFKRDCLPKWFTRRFPVRTRTLENLVHFERWRTYPEADVVLPKGQYGPPRYMEVLTHKGFQ